MVITACASAGVEMRDSLSGGIVNLCSGERRGGEMKKYYEVWAGTVASIVKELGGLLELLEHLVHSEHRSPIQASSKSSFTEV